MLKKRKRREPERETGKLKGVIYIQGIIILRELRKPLIVNDIKPYFISPY